MNTETCLSFAVLLLSLLTVGLQLAVQHVRQHAKWRLSLQSHKWLGIR